MVTLEFASTASWPLIRIVITNGGLHDLVKTDTASDRELDCLGVDIKTFHHPGLSRWTNDKNATPKHKQGLGAFKDGLFIQLLGDRDHATKALNKLSGPWKSFIKDLLNNSSKTRFELILLEADKLKAGNSLPKLWRSRNGCDIRVLGPVATKKNNQIGLPDFGKKSYNTNGHSICLRLDYGNARILLTGDLNSTSMNWLADCFDDRISAWECDVAKACHHGSHDISYRFLEEMKPAATVISSGDAEGHSHPRPEIVGASAITGFVNVDRSTDKLITPLIYMTEIERSVSLGALNRIDFKKVPTPDGTGTTDGAILGRNIDEMSDPSFLPTEVLKKIKKMVGANKKKARNKLIKDTKKIEEPKLQAMENATRTGAIKADFNITVSEGPVTVRTERKRAWRSRIMEKNHYGLVNVRTDGETILCATLDETEKKWVIHNFPARF